jgi:addiction module HigA family antidote
MASKRLEPIHPGEILEEEFMRPAGLSANALAKAVDVPVTRVSDIVRGRRGITADTALRLGRFFGTSAELWLGLQAEYDLRVVRREIGESIEGRIVPLKKSPIRYASESGGTSVSGSEVSELAAAYSPKPHARLRDRRRARRSS